jgi:hypothetical protein
MAKGNKGGRPTSYDPKFVDEAYKYLEQCKDEETEFHKTRGEKSDSYDRILTVKLPTVEGFASYLRVSTKSLNNWANEYPKFLRALDDIKDEQKQRLITKGLSGEYNSTIAKLILSSNHGMAEKTESDITSKGESIAINIIKNGGN